MHFTCVKQFSCCLQQYEIDNNLDVHGKVPTKEHVDHDNPHTFEIEDLKKLILKTTKDLEAADKQRKQEFKVGKLLHLFINLYKPAGFKPIVGH